MADSATPLRPVAPPAPRYVSLPVELVQAALTILVKLPFGEVADVVIPLRQAAVESFQSQEREAAAGPM